MGKRASSHGVVSLQGVAGVASKSSCSCRVSTTNAASQRKAPQPALPPLKSRDLLLVVLGNMLDIASTKEPSDGFAGSVRKASRHACQAYSP